MKKGRLNSDKVNLICTMKITCHVLDEIHNNKVNFKDNKNHPKLLMVFVIEYYTHHKIIELLNGLN